jgi:hypothetical protein
MYRHLHVARRRRKTFEAWEPSNKAMLFVFFLLKEYKIQNKAEVLNQDSNPLTEIGELWVGKYCHVYRI